MARLLGAAASGVFRPGCILVIDESLYEFLGVCPVRRFIPRKPHQNGLLCYCLCGYAYCGQFEFQFVLDYEPYTLDNLVSPQDAMMALFRRLRVNKPRLTPHLVVDSAFGSFDRLDEIVAEGGNATMSMVPTVKPWLWELIDFGCGIDQGRLAELPQKNVVVSSFKVLSETGKEHQIKTISSGCSLSPPDEEEEVVVKVKSRRTRRDKNLEYETLFSGGRTRWLLPEDFIDPDGATSAAFLSFANASDLESAFKKYTLAQLRVPLSLFFIIPSLIFPIRSCARLKDGNRLETSLECSNES